MGHYTNMSGYYDVIMTSGYYDYPKIVDGLINGHAVQTVLELGCGTGLIIEELAKRKPHMPITGVDLTPEMLAIAEERLGAYSNVQLSQQNVCHLQLPQQHDLVFSYGGVWYFVVEQGKEPFMVSHIPSHEDNVAGIQKMASYISSGGHLKLGTQGPHHNYEKTISNGMVYSQEILPLQDGFIKHYYLDDGDERVMEQTIHYRTYSYDEACQMLAAVGLHPVQDLAHHITSPGMFIEFAKS